MSPLVLASEEPVARIEHRCQLCERTIMPGERYSRQRNIGDDGPYVFKACANCAALVQMYPAIWEWADDGYTIDDIAEWYPSSIAEARLKVQWKRRWRRRDGALYPVPTRRDDVRGGRASP